MPPVIAPAAFSDHDPDAAVIDLAGETMGTTWRVRFAGPPGCDTAALRSAILDRLHGIVAEMSHWAPDSHLAHFNRAPAHSWATLPPDFAHVMAAALAIAAASDGGFDPAIGRLVNLWGFGPVATDAPPDEAALDSARAASGYRRLAFDPAARRLFQPGGLSLDLSGIAKGHGVDAIADLLHGLGIRHCLVEIGGELVGRGIRPDGAPWWVDLEVPPGLNLPPLRIALHNLAVATSGDYRRGSHTLDPRTGRPTTNGIVSASVIHASALQADAWATALCVCGPDLANRADLAARIVSADGEYISPALTRMLAD